MNKKWYESKAVWGALVVLVGSVLTAMGYDVLGQTVLGLGTSLGIVGVRLAQK